MSDKKETLQLIEYIEDDVLFTAGLYKDMYDYLIECLQDIIQLELGEPVDCNVVYDLSSSGGFFSFDAVMFKDNNGHIEIVFYRNNEIVEVSTSEALSEIFDE